MGDFRKTRRLRKRMILGELVVVISFDAFSSWSRSPCCCGLGGLGLLKFVVLYGVFVFADSLCERARPTACTKQSHLSATVALARRLPVTRSHVSCLCLPTSCISHRNPERASYASTARPAGVFVLVFPEGRRRRYCHLPPRSLSTGTTYLMGVICTV